MLGDLDEPWHLHFYCSICYKSRKSAKDLCDSCSDDSKRVFFFISIPLEHQLKKLFARPDFMKDFAEFLPESNNGNIENIFDGEVYKEVRRTFPPNVICVTLKFNLDGMQVFTSNNFSLWPCYAVVNELPPQETVSNRKSTDTWSLG